MKSLILTFAGMLFCLAMYGQDTILMKNGNEVRVKILEIGVNDIKYKRFDNQDGPLITVLKQDVFMIKLMNGTKLLMNENKAKEATKTAVNLETKNAVPPVKQPETMSEPKPVEVKKNYKYSAGFSAGFSSGTGLTYRYMPKKLGIQAAIMPYKDNKRTTFFAGLSFLYRLRQTNYTSLFIYEGNQYYYRKKKHEYEYYSGVQQKYIYDFYYTKDEYLTNGIGMGMEFFLGNRVTFDVMLGYAAYDNFERYSLTGETSLLFKFR